MLEREKYYYPHVVVLAIVGFLFLTMPLTPASMFTERVTRTIFPAWRNYLDTLEKEALKVRLEEYENDPRIKAVGKSLSLMKKSELAEAGRKECNLTLPQANQMTVSELRALLKMKRKGDEIDADPMKTKPKGLHNMLKADLIKHATPKSSWNL